MNWSDSLVKVDCVPNFNLKSYIYYLYEREKVPSTLFPLVGWKVEDGLESLAFPFPRVKKNPDYLRCSTS